MKGEINIKIIIITLGSWVSSVFVWAYFSKKKIAFFHWATTLECRVAAILRLGSVVESTSVLCCAASTRVGI